MVSELLKAREDMKERPVLNEAVKRDDVNVPVSNGTIKYDDVNVIYTKNPNRINVTRTHKTKSEKVSTWW